MSQTKAQLVTGLSVNASAPATALNIDSSGRVLVGTSTALGVSSKLEVLNGNTVTSSYLANAFAQAWQFVKSRSTSTLGTIVQSGDELGNITWAGDDGTSTAKQAAAIQVYVDGTPGTNDMPGRLVFSTCSDGSASPSERFRIAQNGAWGLAGANYGSSGQVLTSNGSGSAPTWQAVASDFGVGNTAQTWTNVLSSRGNGTTYTNSTGRPIMMVLAGNDNPNQGLSFSFQVQGSNVGVALSNVAPGYPMIVGVYVVPNGHTYRASWNGAANLASWWELR